MYTQWTNAFKFDVMSLRKICFIEAIPIDYRIAPSLHIPEFHLTPRKKILPPLQMLLVPLSLAPRDARQRVRYAIKTSALATVPLGSWSMAACAREAQLDQFFSGERERVQRVGPGGAWNPRFGGVRARGLEGNGDERRCFWACCSVMRSRDPLRVSRSRHSSLGCFGILE